MSLLDLCALSASAGSVIQPQTGSECAFLVDTDSGHSDKAGICIRTA